MTASLQSPLYLKKAKAVTVRSRLELLGKGVGLMVYLIHLSVPLRRISGGSQHYIGFSPNAKNLEERVRTHCQGNRQKLYSV